MKRPPTALAGLSYYFLPPRFLFPVWSTGILQGRDCCGGTESNGQDAGNRRRSGTRHSADTACVFRCPVCQCLRQYGPARGNAQGVPASVKLLPLLTGSVEVASVELIEPVIELEKGPMVPVTGRSHRRLKPVRGPELKKPGLVKAAKLTRRRSASIGCGLSRALSVYRDAAAGTVQRLENLEADLSAGSIKGPFVKGGVRMMGVSLTIEGRVGSFAGKSAVPFDIAFDLQTLTRSI